MHIIINKIELIRHLIFSRTGFLKLSKVSVVFNISSSYTNTNLPVRRYLHKHFLISRYLSVLILSTKTYINYDSVFVLNYIHFDLFHIYTYTIHAELKIGFILNTLTFIVFTLLYSEHKFEHMENQWCYLFHHTY